MKLKNVLLASVLACVVILGGCGKSNEKTDDSVFPTVAPTESPAENPSGDDSNVPDDNDGEKPENDKAVEAYMSILEEAPAIGNQEVFNDIMMNYEDNLVKFGEHYDTYALYDINKDGISELIATTTVNFKWNIIYIFTYVDGNVVLLDDPRDPAANGTFNQNCNAGGDFSLKLCSDNHIHNVWTGLTPFDEEVEESYAYSLEGKEFKEVECSVTGSKNIINYSDIAKTNEFVNYDIEIEPEPMREINIDYYSLPEVYLDVMTEKDMTAYNSVIEAWLNYEPKVRIETPSQQEMLWGVIKECFFIIYSDFDEEKGFTYDDEYVYFPYVSSTKEEHDLYISEFEDRVQSFYKGISDEEEGIELAKDIYINFNRTLAYNYDLLDEDNKTLQNTSGYTAIMEGSGVCMSFARAYAFLARQAGLEAFSVVGLGNSTDVEDHEWGALKVGDKYYFVDPTWDYVDEPEYYQYFCFGLDKRIENGYPEDKMSIAGNGDLIMGDYVTIEREDLEY